MISYTNDNINVETWSSLLFFIFIFNLVKSFKSASLQLVVFASMSPKTKYLSHLRNFEYTRKVIKEDKVIQNCIVVQF